MKRHRHTFTRRSPAPDVDRHLSLQHRVVADHPRQTKLRKTSLHHAPAQQPHKNQRTKPTVHLADPPRARVPLPIQLGTAPSTTKFFNLFSNTKSMKD